MMRSRTLGRRGLNHCWYVRLMVSLRDGTESYKSIENLAEREGFEPSIQVLARITV